MMKYFPLNSTVTYDYLSVTNQLNDKQFMRNDLIKGIYKFLGRKRGFETAADSKSMILYDFPLGFDSKLLN